MHRKGGLPAAGRFCDRRYELSVTTFDDMPLCASYTKPAVAVALVVALIVLNVPVTKDKSRKRLTSSVTQCGALGCVSCMVIDGTTSTPASSKGRRSYHV